MSGRNATIDYCGVIRILRHLVVKGICTEKEARKNADRIAAQYGADIIIWPYFFVAFGYGYSESVVVMCVADKR